MKNVIENNKLIAEFMGFEGQHEDWCGNNIVDLNEFVDENQLRPYNPHERWDDLMPVVEKIESLNDYSEYNEVDIFGNCCDIGGEIETLGTTKIEATYKAVVDFIEEYNKMVDKVKNI